MNRDARSGFKVSKNICLHHQLINITYVLLWANIVEFVIVLFTDVLFPASQRILYEAISKVDFSKLQNTSYLIGLKKTHIN